MNAHDYLMSELIRLRKLLSEFNEEHDPPNRDTAEVLLNRLLVNVHNMPRLTEELSNRSGTQCQN